MFKPWIIVAIGTVMLAGASAKIHNPFHQKKNDQPQPQPNNGLVEQTNEVTFYDYNNVEELENFDSYDFDVQEEDAADVLAYDGEKQNWLERAVVETYKNMKAQFEGESKREVVKKIQ